MKIKARLSTRGSDRDRAVSNLARRFNTPEWDGWTPIGHIALTYSRPNGGTTWVAAVTLERELEIA